MTGVLGFCLGGTLAFGVAAAGDPAVCVSYYGSGVPELLDRLDDVSCPTLFHFGTDDAFVPLETVDELRVTLMSNPNVEFDTYHGAGHAFDNPHAPWYDADAAARAWDRTVQFLGEHLQG